MTKTSGKFELICKGLDMANICHYRTCLPVEAIKWDVTPLNFNKEIRIKQANNIIHL